MILIKRILIKKKRVCLVTKRIYNLLPCLVYSCSCMPRSGMNQQKYTAGTQTGWTGTTGGKIKIQRRLYCNNLPSICQCPPWPSRAWWRGRWRSIRCWQGFQGSYHSRLSLFQQKDQNPSEKSHQSHPPGILGTRWTQKTKKIIFSCEATPWTVVMQQ